MCVGDLIQKLIGFLTLGFGKRLALRIANLLGFEDCGCSKRQQWLNELFKCNKGVEL